MKVKITNKKDKTDAYSLNLSKAFGVRRMGDALIVYYGGSDAMFSFPSKHLNENYILTHTFIFD